MKKKWTVAPQEWWDPAAIESWLEDEARKGWRVASCNGWFARLEKAEPKDCRVRIQYQGPMERKAWEERIDAYEALGWELAAVRQQSYEIFYCDDPEAPEPDTDPEVYAMAWKEPLRWSWLGGWALFLVPLLLAVEILVLDTTLLQLLLRSSFRLLFFELIVTPFSVVLAVRQLLRVTRARKMLKAGMKPNSGNWKHNRRWWQVTCAMFLAFVLLAPVGDVVMAAKMRDTDTMPSIRPEATEESVTEKWMLDLSGYAWQSTPLRPVLFDTRWYREGQSVANSENRLQFAFLAKALYREKIKAFCADHPGAEKEVIENPAFDEAILLSGGGEQMVLVRSDTIVYALRVDFPVELRDYIEIIAAEMTPQEGGAS